jgi:DNA-binding HxlR family transcriptional regulator
MQGRMTDANTPSECQMMNAVLARVADRWSVQIIYALGKGPMRFNALKRELAITQGVLAQTLRDLEAEGLVSRHETEGLPPRVEYDLTRLGHSFREPVMALARWALENGCVIDAHRMESCKAAKHPA